LAHIISIEYFLNLPFHTIV